MSKILDLSAFVDETLDIKMPNGEEMNLCKPSKKMTIEVLKLKEISDNSTEEEIMDASDRLVFHILNSNINKRIVTEDEVEKMSIRIKMAIINAYVEFLTGIQNNPN